MRSARMLLAAATATAALAIAAPAAYAEATWDHDDNSYSKEHDKHGSHDSPHGGMHTGGGALTAVSQDDWGTAKDPKTDPDTYRNKDSDGGGKENWSKDSGSSEESWGGKEDTDSWSGKQGKESSGGKEDNDSWGSDHAKPHGGMHTGGGALASPGLTAGGLAVLGVTGAGLYTLRRKKVSEGVA